MDIHHSDCHMLPLDVLDVSEQCVSFHVGGRVTHVSDVPGMCKYFFLSMFTIKLVKVLFLDTGLFKTSLPFFFLFLSASFHPHSLLLKYLQLDMCEPAL